MSFYTYAYQRQDGTPYYVGKGTGIRAFNANRLVARPKSRARIIVQHWESEAKAFEMEKWWIEFWGRKDIETGILRNMTNGGEGQTGRVYTEEIRKNMSDAHEGNKSHLGHRHS